MPKRKRTPLLPFDVDAFLGSAKVGAMTAAQVGVYTLLLIHDWKESGFEFAPEEDTEKHEADRRRLARICHLTTPTFLRAWKDAVGACFEERGGRYRNARIDLERLRLSEWQAKSRKGGKKTAQAKVNQHPNHLSTTVDPKRTPARSRVVQHSVFEPNPEAVVAGANWLTPYVDAYAEYVGHEKPGRIAAVVAPVREAVGDEGALYAFTAWCRDPKRGYNVGAFGGRWRDYENFEVVDEDGNLTPRGAAYIKASGL
jgi:uncharacterized protein YdaU (DUF1376 family)